MVKALLVLLLVLNLEDSLLSGANRIAITPGVASVESEIATATLIGVGLTAVGGGDRQIVSGWVTSIPAPSSSLLVVTALAFSIVRRPRCRTPFPSDS